MKVLGEKSGEIIIPKNLRLREAIAFKAYEFPGNIGKKDKVNGFYSLQMK